MFLSTQFSINHGRPVGGRWRRPFRLKSRNHYELLNYHENETPLFNRDARPDRFSWCEVSLSTCGTHYVQFITDLNTEILCRFTSESKDTFVL